MSRSSKTLLGRERLVDENPVIYKVLKARNQTKEQNLKQTTTKSELFLPVLAFLGLVDFGVFQEKLVEGVLKGV